MSKGDFNFQLNELSPVLKAFAYNLTQNVEDAKDLFQETAMRAVKNQDKFKPDTNLKAWLFTIMKNIFINNYRRKVRANTFTDSTDNLYYLNSGQQSNTNKGEANTMIEELKALIRFYAGEDFEFEPHFTPKYRPWQQRLAFIPDGDLFQGIASGAASVVTDEIECFKYIDQHQ